MDEVTTAEIVHQQRDMEEMALGFKLEVARKNRELRRYMRSYQDSRFSTFYRKTMEELRLQYTALATLMMADSVELAALSYDIKKRDVVRSIQKLESHRNPLLKMSGEWRNRVIAAASSEALRLNSQGYKNSQIVTALGGANGPLQMGETSSVTSSRTMSKLSMEDVKVRSYQGDRQVIGYLWVSVLDGRTSQTCQDLSGREFYFARSGAKPRPPQHPNCRSSTAPITKEGGVPEYESFADWAKKESSQDDLRRALGKTRYELYTQGKLRIDRFTDVTFKPRTLDEIAKRNEVAVRRTKRKSDETLRI